MPACGRRAPGLIITHQLTVLEAITLAKMSLVNAFTHNRSSNTRCVALMAQIYSVTPLPIENPHFHENKNNRCLLEKAITFEWQGFFTTPTYYTLRIVWRVIWWKVFNVGCVVLENINYLKFLSYLRPFRDEILTAIFILFSTWLLTSTCDLQPSTAIANQLPGHLVSTQIRTIGLNHFKFIELIMPNTKIVQITEWLADSMHLTL